MGSRVSALFAAAFCQVRIRQYVEEGSGMELYIDVPSTATMRDVKARSAPRTRSLASRGHGRTRCIFDPAAWRGVARQRRVRHLHSTCLVSEERWMVGRVGVFLYLECLVARVSSSRSNVVCEF